MIVVGDEGFEKLLKETHKFNPSQPSLLAHQFSKTRTVQPDTREHFNKRRITFEKVRKVK